MKKKIFEIILFLSLLFISYYLSSNKIVSYNISNIPNYNGKDYIYINNNEPSFDKNLINTNSFESYSNLDLLGRVGVALANISIDLMPTKEREDISFIKPTGFVNKKYDFIEYEYLYNRCHLIAFSLTGENANEKNLMTCTRNMNSNVMTKFENKVINYIRKTNNHVLYRVTPIFEGDNLLSKGVQMEALSIEDNGKGIKFNVFIYNVEDGIEIDYKTGENRKKDF